MTNVTTNRQLNQIDIGQRFTATKQAVLDKMDALNDSHAKTHPDSCLFVVIDDLENIYQRVN